MDDKSFRISEEQLRVLEFIFEILGGLAIMLMILDSIF